MKSDYAAKILRIRHDRPVLRNKSFRCRVTIKNTGTKPLADIAGSKQAEALGGKRVKLVLDKHLDAEHVVARPGVDAEKFDWKFESVSRVFANHMRRGDRHVLLPGQKATLLYTLRVKKFAPKKRLFLSFSVQEIGSQDSVKTISPSRRHAIKLSESSNRLRDFKRFLMLTVFSPGKTSSVIENKAYKDIDASSVRHVVMATWQRVDYLADTVRDLEKQAGEPVVLHLWNNNRRAAKRIREIVDKSKLPIRIFNSRFNIGGFGRFYLAKQLAEEAVGHVLFIDDDQRLSRQTLNQIFALKKPKTIYSRWGWVFDSKTNYWDKHLAKPGEAVEYAGTCGMLADTDVFKNNGLYECPSKFWFVEDYWLSYFARTQGWELQAMDDNGISTYDDAGDQKYGLIDTKNKLHGFIVSQQDNQ